MREKMIDDIIDLNDIPVQALSTGTISKLDCMLDKEKILLSRPGGLPRDYRGIAELLNVSIIDGWLGEKAMMKLIREFGPKNQLTLGKLQTYFEKIDRYDVLDDTSNMFDEDAREYVKKMNSLVPIQANHHFRNIERDMLTEDDIVRIPSGNGPQTYNAFILYVDEDRHFAEELISKMENEYGLKICDRDRDLIPGLTFEDSAIQRLIAERCDRLIVILSNEFVRSDRHTFLFKYAQAISCDQGRRKVIPCIYKKCELPLEYRIFMFLDYERYNGGILGDFWSKLNNSLLPIENSVPTLVKNDEPKGVKIEDITAKDAKTEDLRSNKVENEKKMQFSNQNVNLKSDVSNKENEFVLKNDKTVFLNKRNLSFGTKINNFFIKIKKPRNTDTAHIVEEKKTIGLSSGNVEYEEKNQFSNASLKSDVSTKEHDSLLKDEKVVISNKKNLSFGKIKNNILIKIKKPRRKEAVCAL